MEDDLRYGHTSFYFIIEPDPYMTGVATFNRHFELVAVVPLGCNVDYNSNVPQKSADRDMKLDG